MIIGIHGEIGCGKDSAAGFLVAAGWQRRAFADALKEEVALAYNLDEAIVELYGARDNKELPMERLEWRHCSEIAFRRVLTRAIPADQRPSWRDVTRLWGTEYRRAQCPRYWINAMEQFVATNPGDCVAPDVRFEDEAEWIREHGILVHIVRPDNPYASVMSSHASDRGVAYDPDRDVIIENNAGLCALGVVTLSIAGGLLREHV